MTATLHEDASVLRVLVVYKDALLRDVLVSSLKEEKGIDVVHQCRESEFSPSLIQGLRLDVVLADRMAERSFIALLDAVTASRRPVRLVSVNLFQDDLVVYRATRQRNAGIADLVSIVRDASSTATATPVVNGTH